MGKEAGTGDVVTLYSGGPDLTVLRVYDEDSQRVADFCWFTAAGEYRTGTLPLAVLRMRVSVEQVAPVIVPSVLSAPTPEHEPSYRYSISPVENGRDTPQSRALRLRGSR